MTTPSTTTPGPQKPTTRDLEQLPQEPKLENLSYIRKEMIEAMQGVSKNTDRGASTLLLSIGAVTLLFSLVSKLGLFRSRLTSLTVGEFIAAMVISTVLLLLGAAIRLYQFKKEQEAGKRIRESGVELLSKQMDINSSLATRETPAKSSLP